MDTLTPMTLDEREERKKKLQAEIKAAEAEAKAKERELRALEKAERDKERKQFIRRCLEEFGLKPNEIKERLGAENADNKNSEFLKIKKILDDIYSAYGAKTDEQQKALMSHLLSKTQIQYYARMMPQQPQIQRQPTPTPAPQPAPKPQPTAPQPAPQTTQTFQ